MGFKTIKINLSTYQPAISTCYQSAMKYNPRLQLHSIFQKTGNRNKLKVLIVIGIVTIQSHRLSSFSTIKKTVTGVEEGGGGQFLLFLSLFSSVNINPQYKFNSSHKNLFIITVSTHFFTSARSLLFFLIFLDVFNE